MSAPLVSVILPVRDGARYLGEALDSIFAQAHRPLEVIVVDDDSRDASGDIARAYPEARVLHGVHGGCAAARNAGVASARGELYAFLDSDDRWTPDKLARQVAVMLERPEVAWSIAQMRNFLEPGCPEPEWCRGKAGAVEIGLVPGTLLVRREAFERVGWFDPAFRHGSDTEWFFRAKDAGLPFAQLREVLLERRIHDANLSATRGPEPAILMRIMKRSIDRMRARKDSPP